MSESVRIDKWLWSVRLFKTRSLATDYCKSGKVLIDGVVVKPSRMVRINELILIKRPPVNYTYKVTGLIEKRVSAALSVNHVQNLTPQSELDKLKEVQDSLFFKRDRGTGRPTKKERRDLDKLQS